MVSRDCNDAPVAQDLDHSKVVEDAVIIELAPCRWTNVASIQWRMSRDFLFLIDNGRSDPKRSAARYRSYRRGMSEQSNRRR